MWETASWSNFFLKKRAFSSNLLRFLIRENMLASLERSFSGMNCAQMLSRSLNSPHLEAGKEDITWLHSPRCLQSCEAKPKGSADVWLTAGHDSDQIRPEAPSQIKSGLVTGWTLVRLGLSSASGGRSRDKFVHTEPLTNKEEFSAVLTGGGDPSARLLTFWLVNSSERGCCCEVLDAEFTFFVLCRKGNSPLHIMCLWSTLFVTK